MGASRAGRHFSPQRAHEGAERKKRRKERKRIYSDSLSL
jgi:hypothetical protein